MPFIAFSEDVVPYWRCCFIRDWCLFISSSFKTLHISWAAADLQTLEFFNLCVCSIYCFGVFPSPSSPDAFTGSEVSTALSLMDCLSPTEFKAGSDTGEPGVCWLAQFVLIPPFLSFQILVVYAGLTDLFLLHRHLHELLSQGLVGVHGLICQSLLQDGDRSFCSSNLHYLNRGSCGHCRSVLIPLSQKTAAPLLVRV